MKTDRRAARTRGLFLMEAMWTRCFPLLRRLRALLDEGADRLLHRNLRVGPVAEEEVEVVDLQALQGCITGVTHKKFTPAS